MWEMFESLSKRVEQLSAKVEQAFSSPAETEKSQEPQEPPKPAAPPQAPPMYCTADGNFYFVDPVVVVLAEPSLNYQRGVYEFFESFTDADEYRCQAYDDSLAAEREGGITAADKLCKFAGQLCYLSFGAGSTPDTEADSYFARIRRQGHGSVLEHASFSFLIYGVSRSLTHELVRHRAGWAYSQVSQRYVDKVRFVRRPEFDTAELVKEFEDRIDLAAKTYQELVEKLSKRLESDTSLSRTERRKAARQAARACLPNETETALVATCNLRALRHFLEMRGSSHAEPEIRKLALAVYNAVLHKAPSVLSDYRVEKGCLVTDTPKV
jgi:thymidylate synthase (FAD)